MTEPAYSVQRDVNVVAIGGGTGLSTLLRGLKLYTKEITAIVTVADDGGGSGVLRQELGMLPPGDIRNCMESLAGCESMMSQLIHYRFTDGALAGQSFGNLLLAALNGILPSFEEAVEGLSRVLAITGRVLPVTTADVQLEAEFENGVRVTGESSIASSKRMQHCRIRRVKLVPEGAVALRSALDAIAAADLIVLGPGSLYTSIIPDLLVDGVVEAIRNSHALKVYVANVMTQIGETEGYTLSDHLRAMQQHTGVQLVDVCLANASPIPAPIAQRYAAEGAEVLLCDSAACQALGVEVVSRAVSTVDSGHVRHNPGQLARELLALYHERLAH